MRKRNDERTLRREIAALLDAGGAHRRAAEILADVPVRLRGSTARGLAHTPWEILEHLRLAQRDILEWSLDPGFESPKWPEGYWPPSAKPPDSKAWDRSAREFLRDLRRCVRLAQDPRRNLLAPIAHHPEATLLGELGLVASHNSYHLGQLVDLRRLLAARPLKP
jgi:hypothetical protein